MLKISPDFIISEDPRGNTLGRGTQINIHLKPEATEYLEEDKLKGLVRKCKDGVLILWVGGKEKLNAPLPHLFFEDSEFINFPIYLWVSKTKTEEIPDPSAVEEEDKKNDSMEEQDGDVEDAPEESAEKEKKPKTKTITKKYQDWEKMNENKPIWIRSPKKVTETEYKEFYRAFTKETKDPMNWIHFKAEGEVDFRSILYIPSKSPSGFLTKSEEITRNIKLFVRRVFITDELADFLPRYLGFLRGLVDSDDLPLNVSRETLQQSAILRLIKKKIIGKAMEMFKKMSENEEEWDKFIREYGIALKLGITEDNANRKKLSKLVRFRSSFSDTKLTSLDDYVKRMKKNQPQIYVCTGNDINEIKRSPFLEKLLGRGYEVLVKKLKLKSR